MVSFNALISETKASFAVGESPFLLPALAAVIGIALIALLISVIIKARASRPVTITEGPLDLYQPKSPVVIDRTNTRKNMTGSYTFAFYVRIDAVPDMRASATPLLTWPGIWDLNYNAAQEELVWIFSQTRDSAEAPEPEKIVLPRVPMQKWIQIGMTFEGRTVDLYVNGKLVKSDTLNNLPQNSNSSITIVTGGIMGQIGYIQLWPRRLTVNDIGSNYIDTSDSQGRPYLNTNPLTNISKISVPNLFCPSGGCTGDAKPSAKPSQTWEFPYA
jgi:hypothetical protein